MIPFRRLPGVQAFTCGNKDLDEFLATTEVDRYERAGLARTFLVFGGEALVGYYTLSCDSLRTEYVGTPQAAALEGVAIFPAVKVGRLAIASSWQGRGLGRILVEMIAAEALSIGERCGVRLLILEAKPEAVAFYKRCGLQMTRETRRERGKRNRTMFLDLRVLKDGRD